MAIKQAFKFYVSSVAVEGFDCSTDFDTDALNLQTFRGEWVLEVTRTLTDGTPVFSIQCSMNGTDWRDYNPESSSVTPPEIIIDSDFYPNFMRISYVANSATGDITIQLTSV